MTIRTFFGEIRRKLLRIALGKDLFVQLTSVNEKFNQVDSKLNQIDGNISQQLSGPLFELRSHSHELTKHIHESKTIREINTKAFAKYRNIYKNREIVIMGAGPTLKYYEPVENCITIGTNGVVLYDKVKLDFLFVQDVNAMYRYGKEIIDYDCKKFISFWGSFNWTMPLKYKDIQNMEEYCNYPVGHINGVGYINNEGYAGHSIPLDICNSPLSDFESVIFPVVQFALWTYPKRIYIAGCDCSHNAKRISPHYGGDSKEDEKNELFPTRQHVNGWKKIKEFQQIYYPDVEMISINPVFLKGLFKDEFTDSYLKDNPDVGKL